MDDEQYKETVEEIMTPVQREIHEKLTKLLVDQISEKIPEDYVPLDVMCPGKLDPSTGMLIVGFATALAEKLYSAQKKYNYTDGWAREGWADECREYLRQHLEKGDPRDVAAYCAFLWFHGESTTDKKSDEIASS